MTVRSATRLAGLGLSTLSATARSPRSGKEQPPAGPQVARDAAAARHRPRDAADPRRDQRRRPSPDRRRPRGGSAPASAASSRSGCSRKAPREGRPGPLPDRPAPSRPPSPRPGPARRGQRPASSRPSARPPASRPAGPAGHQPARIRHRQLRQQRRHRRAGQAALRQAELNLSHATVTAPVGGITGRSVVSGRYFARHRRRHPADHRGAGQPDGCVSIPEGELTRRAMPEGRFKPQAIRGVRLVLPTAAATQLRGKLNFAASQIDPSSAPCGCAASSPTRRPPAAGCSCAHAHHRRAERRLQGTPRRGGADRQGPHRDDRRRRQP